MFFIPFHLVAKALPTIPMMLLKAEEDNYIPNKTQEGSIDPRHLSVVYQCCISVEWPFVTT